MEYYENAEVRSKIDAVLHENAMIFQNCGTDSTEAEKKAARIKERNNLREVKHLSPKFIGKLLSDSLSDEA
jgi:hypothetical protein